MLGPPDPCSDGEVSADRRIETQCELGDPVVTRPVGADFDLSFQPSIDRKQIQELATVRFLANGENITLLGPPGVQRQHHRHLEQVLLRVGRCLR